jgi:hypothetical protein
MPDARIHTLTYGEAEALAERLLARGTSKLFAAAPGIGSDLILASRLILALLRDFATGEIIDLDAGRRWR